MEPISVGILGLAVTLVLLASGVHIALTLGLVGLVGTMLITSFQSGAWLSTSIFYFAVGNFNLIAVPLFVLMGLVAGAGGVGRNLYNATDLWLSRVRGSLGIATVLSCTAFGMVTGSSLVCTAVFARVSAPEMRRHGYDKKLAYGICSSAGAIGMLIPPSVLMVIYGILSELSIGKLLIAGIAPGLLLTVSFSAGILAISYLNPKAVGGGMARMNATWRQRFASLKTLWPVALVGVAMIGGLFGGVFGPSEAAAIGSIVIIFTTIVTAGAQRWQILRSGIFETISTTAMIFFILAGASIFARFLLLSGVTPAVLNYVINLNLSTTVFILAMVFIYLVLGCFLDSISILSITLPTIIPVVNAMGIQPIWFAMVSILAIEVGLITPPVGLNVFAARAMAEPDVKLEEIFQGVMPFFFLMLATLGIIIAFPWLSTILPSLMFSR